MSFYKIEQILKEHNIKYTKKYLDEYPYGFFVEVNPVDEQHIKVKQILKDEFKYCFVESIDWNEDNILCEYLTYSYVI